MSGSMGFESSPTVPAFSTDPAEVSLSQIGSRMTRVDTNSASAGRCAPVFPERRHRESGAAAGSIPF
jgi:hypothetical protein